MIDQTGSTFYRPSVISVSFLLHFFAVLLVNALSFPINNSTHESGSNHHSQVKISNPTKNNNNDAHTNHEVGARLYLGVKSNLKINNYDDKLHLHRQIQESANIIKVNDLINHPTYFKDIYPNLSLNANVSLSWKKCMKLYGQRNYLDDSKKRLPPMLYTFPGSGNTWAR
jgi:hypothetical protein